MQFVENVDVIAQIQKMLFIHRDGPAVLFARKEIKDPLVVTEFVVSSEAKQKFCGHVD
jgi:hypothetical protein